MQYFVKILGIDHVPVQKENSDTGHKSFYFCTEPNKHAFATSQRLNMAQKLKEKIKT